MSPSPYCFFERLKNTVDIHASAQFLRLCCSAVIAH